MNIKIRLTAMNFLQYAVWGAYLTSMGTFLAGAGLAENIGWFYAVQGFVSLFMPAIIGIVADRWVPAQKLLGLCHLLAAAGMAGAAYFGSLPQVSFALVFAFYTFSVAFYMPTIALSNSVAYTALRQGGFNTVSAFPPIRVFGTVGFICAMLTSNFTGFQNTYMQWYFSGILGVILGLYCFTLPACPTCTEKAKSLAEALGLKAFALFKEKKMAIFFIFSMLLGMSLQITNAYANPFINGFNSLAGFAGSWGANNANALISLSQMSETLCILLIPFCLKRFGIKKVLLLGLVTAAIRYGFFIYGSADEYFTYALLFLGILLHGVSYDFYYVTAYIYVDKKAPVHMRTAAQGLITLCCQGFGSLLGYRLGGVMMEKMFAYQEPVNGLTFNWSGMWTFGAVMIAIIAVLFMIFFRESDNEITAIKVDDRDIALTQGEVK